MDNKPVLTKAQREARSFLPTAKIILQRMQSPGSHRVWIESNDPLKLIKDAINAFEQLEQYEECAKLVEIRKQYV